MTLFYCCTCTGCVDALHGLQQEYYSVQRQPRLLHVGLLITQCSLTIFFQSLMMIHCGHSNGVHHQHPSGGGNCYRWSLSSYCNGSGTKACRWFRAFCRIHSFSLPTALFGSTEPGHGSFNTCCKVSHPAFPAFFLHNREVDMDMLSGTWWLTPLEYLWWRGWAWSVGFVVEDICFAGELHMLGQVWNCMVVGCLPLPLKAEGHVNRCPEMN